MKYRFIYQDYDNGPTENDLNTFIAADDRAALKKIFNRMVRENGGTIEDLLDDLGISKAQINEKFMTDYLNGIEEDVSSIPVEIKNLETGKVLYRYPTYAKPEVFSQLYHCA